jgi:hypothetical protein
VVKVKGDKATKAKFEILRRKTTRFLPALRKTPFAMNLISLLRL